jgi:hypothetical protein
MKLRSYNDSLRTTSPRATLQRDLSAPHTQRLQRTFTIRNTHTPPQDPPKPPKALTKIISSPPDHTPTYIALQNFDTRSTSMRHLLHLRRFISTSSTSTSSRKPPSVLRYTLILLKARPTAANISTLSVYAKTRSRRTEETPPPPYEP